MWKKVVIAALSSLMLFGAAAVTTYAADENETPMIPFTEESTSAEEVSEQSEETEEVSQPTETEPEEEASTEEGSSEPEVPTMPEETEVPKKPGKLKVSVNQAESEITVGEDMEISIIPSGGTAPYTYLFSVKRDGTNEKWQKKESDKSGSFSLPTDKTGYYTVNAGVRGADGREVYTATEYAVIKETGKTLKKTITCFI